MESLCEYTLQVLAQKDMTAKGTRLVFRNAFEDQSTFLRHLMNAEVFQEMNLPRNVQLQLAKSMEIHVVPSHHRIVMNGDCSLQNSIPNEVQHESNLVINNQTLAGNCSTKDLAFLIMTKNSVEMISKNDVICTIERGDVVGLIPERHAFAEFESVYSRVKTNNNNSAVLLAFPVLLLRNSVGGGLSHVFWHQNSWINILNNQLSTKNGTIPDYDTVVAGLIRPVMLNYAPKRLDLKKIIPFLTATQIYNKGQIIYDDNHDRPKQKGRYWFVIARGTCSVKTWEEDEIIRDQQHESQLYMNKSSKLHKKNAQIYKAGDSFGLSSSSDRRRTHAKATSDNTLLLKMSEIYVDEHLAPLIKKQILRNHHFKDLVETHVNGETSHQANRFEYLYALGRSLAFLKELSTDIRNRLLLQCPFVQISGNVWNQSDHAGYAIVLLEGELVARTKAGVYKRIQPGELFGGSCFNGCPYRFCTVETVNPSASVKLLNIGVPEFMASKREHLLYREQLDFLSPNCEFASDSEESSTDCETEPIAKHQHGFHASFPTAIPIPVQEILNDEFDTSSQVALREKKRSQNEWKIERGQLIDVLKRLSFFKQFLALDEFNGSNSTMNAFACCVGYVNHFRIFYFLGIFLQHMTIYTKRYLAC
jgi:hypothetical protein